MYIISGTFSETPQQTHFWNNVKLDDINQVRHLKDEMKVYCSGVSTVRRWLFGFPIFHVPIFGGWRDYVVLQSCDANQEWHIGWIASDVCGISRIKLSGSVRVLLGPDDVEFFGIDMEGRQIPICKIDKGKIGSGGKYKHISLL